MGNYYCRKITKASKIPTLLELCENTYWRLTFECCGACKDCDASEDNIVAPLVKIGEMFGQEVEVCFWDGTDFVEACNWVCSTKGGYRLVYGTACYLKHCSFNFEIIQIEKATDPSIRAD